VSFVRNRREHSVRIAELGGSLENFGMVQQRAIEHPVSIDDETIVDVETPIEHRSIHVSKGRVLARRSQPRPRHLAD